ncbi:Dipeptidyl aminopeptidases/acylaminoacyl-peptidases-like protein [uncultured Sphingopyxis sp.]|uniref:Dipeptidyl aminopeptidases/acylaminoacyl-peptidases-like protein n=1 Tax=uncultured Sphingopyxis sp. TaxID=310581 RepID=A0A1Y5PRX1_9SPHN|nr:prolyl oligopeptidase family serine peptidase [uncultured Sphingopyxis sp.]SBV32739.1 Dipeptidyl aminopeptidases/acylaminoacyl-peptidases-like protein [uncultured Sphingopyxis sp.]
MLNSHKPGLFAAAFLAAVTLSPASPAGERKGRPWTFEDILLVPEVNELALSADGRFAIYSAEIADSSAKRTRAQIRIVDIRARTQRSIANADIAKSLKRIPGSGDWSGLLDIGEGLQLYRIAADGKISPIVKNPDRVAVGKADLSVVMGGGTPPHEIGILAYDWSPDGQWLWFSQLKAKSGPPPVRFDDAVTRLRSRRRSSIEAEVEFFLRAPDGSIDKIITRPTSDRMAMHAGGKVIWRGDEILFRTEAPDGTPGSVFETLAWNRKQKSFRIISNERDARTLTMLRGPRGGALSATGIGAALDLVENGPGNERHHYGRFAFTIGDHNYATSLDGRKTIIGTRSLGTSRYGLALVEKTGVREITGTGSLTKCSFDDQLSFAICVEEGVSMPPRLVRVDIARDATEPIVTISPRHDEIAPLQARARTWINRNGYKASGYVLYPREFRPGTRYPAIVITHGFDADERFAKAENQWNYPAQLFAERGYVVLLINDPSPYQSADLRAAYSAWSRGSGPPDPETVRRLIWIEGVHSLVDAINELAAEGLVDPARVGIAGYSRGAQMVNVAITRTRIFSAASSGDGGFLEPSGYAGWPASYDPVYSGSPMSEHFEQYRRFAPSLNAVKVCTPVLQQVAAASPAQAELFDALRAAKVPTQLTYYPGASPASDETHIFHIPSNRIVAMRENMAWFDYWLLGKRDTDAPFPERFAVWDRMAANGKPRCGTAESVR